MRAIMTFAAAAMCLLCLSAKAQTAEADQMEELKKSHKVVYFGEKEKQAHADSIRNVIERFYVTQYHHFQDPRRPTT